MTYRLVNLICFQITWLACVQGAAAGRPALGLVVFGLFLALHVRVVRATRHELLLIAAAAVAGYVADSGLVLAGVIRFPSQAVLGTPSALWMVALWANLALTLNASLAWLSRSDGWAAAFGAVGGALSYWAGDRMGAIQLGEPLWRSLLAIGFEWSVAMPGLLLASRWLRSRMGGTRTPDEQVHGR